MPLLLLLTACGGGASADLEAEVRRLDSEVAELRAELDAIRGASDSMIRLLESLSTSRQIPPDLMPPLEEAPLGHEERCVPELIALLSNTEALARSGRALLHINADASPDGFRMSRLRRGSELDRMGLRSGDILHSVDGTKIDSIDVAKSVYDKLIAQKPEQITLALTRRGTPHELVLRSGGCEPTPPSE